MQLEKSEKESEEMSLASHSLHLPPCDIDVFKGDYLSWPTFRDMFTAIYILNKRLTPIQKLYYLNQKTQGEAKEIVKKCDLTNEGFNTAWKNLCDRYENKRILVNTQLKILFNLNTVDSECGSSIKRLQRDINNCISSLESHQIDISNWDPIITYLCSTKLPEETLSLWEQSVENKTEISKWSDMDRFLSSRFQTLESVSGLRGIKTSKFSKVPSHKHSSEPSHKKLGVFQTSVAKYMCKMCQSNEHRIHMCPKFLKMSVADRISFVKTNNSCFNCLSFGHSVSKCTSSYNCANCHSRHHTLLHNQTAPPKTATRENTSNPADNLPSTSRQAQLRNQASKGKSNQVKKVQSHHANTSKGVLLGTARVTIHYNGTNYAARALIDSGSECSFITERLRRRINLPTKKMHAQVSGINNTVSAQVKEACSIQLRSPIDPFISIDAIVLVLPTLTGNLPTCDISALTQQAFPDLILADKRFYVNEQVDLVLGGDIYPHIILSGIKKNVLSTLLAQETVFGWILTGRADAVNPTNNNRVSFFNEVALDKQLSSFWELEDLPRDKTATAEEAKCEELYKRTTQRNPDGRYIVSLPFKAEFPADINLGPSLKIAFSQFYKNETRLRKNPDLQREYNKVIMEYETMGHMSKVNAIQSADAVDSYYLPHHAVVKEESTTTKVRVVFNASSSSANGVSLNDILLPGPVLQSDLPVLILRWRLFRYVFNSDIEKMYRQILVDANQTKYQRIIFRTCPNEPISIYELKTVTFGINCAPYLAIRTLLPLADDSESLYPIASDILRKSMYVDDVLAGGHTIDSAIKARDEISAVLKSAGFPLRKWTSNCNKILQGIPKAHLLSENFLEFEDTSSVKALGIRWNAHSDQFYFIAKPIEDNVNPTKRAILSAIAKLFDPLGWLAPMIIVAKILMQSIWLEGTDWDETVSPTTLDRWQNFTRNYQEINNIRIPRWVSFSPTEKVEIHGFCDASEKAYAAAVYLRVEKEDKVLVNLLLAKTRVAPVKTISLPRLELCGAVLLSEIVESITKNLELGHLNIHLWTDSTIVLAWIRKPPCSWSTFVAHRITKILDKVGNLNWLHVDSATNPADLASRGILANELVKNSLWWQGPSWLQENREKWPIQETDFTTSIEEKRVHVHATTSTDKINDILDRFSSLPRALRVISYILRFFQRTHPKTKASFQSESCSISSNEIKSTTTRLIKLAQKQHYGAEIAKLKTKECIESKSEILPLNPFLDKDDVLRTGGRLGTSLDLAYNERHPVILPYNCRLSRLIVQFIHETSLHGENQLMLRLIRTQYWIPKVKTMIRSTIHNCKICTIYKKRAQGQLMGILPQERTTFSRPFTNAGVDFAGPFDIKSYRGRGCRMSKGYVCLFVCFSTKAIHLEATSDLSTQSFLAAFSRFVSRRGCPKNVYSDNGTNFVGASRALKAELKAFLSDARTNTLCPSGIDLAFHTCRSSAHGWSVGGRCEKL
ncbi:PREDICTED: uncharacterized protein LOC108378971 isoform X1 [Rhagoletis zephyria]|uniref:uncharacterized protein LOC108378971 isoform X1 n=1 Tax=Rhagoletis zephyria TaxID=28612 RepID=UPI000811936E|nr:PREDICTED: uncharacterized protein LOC108378971 isoform X1 [Rhagoletis zephyria]